MLNQTFSPQNLASLLRPSDFQKFKFTKKNDDHLKVMAGVCQSLSDGSFTFSTLSCRHKKTKPVFSTECISDEMVLRKLNENLRRLYKVKQADRSVIVSQVTSLLKESVPMHILKMDIKSFYESISRNDILSKIKEDSLLSYQSFKLLELFFSGPQFCSMPGLPRGVCISATLSEIFMEDVDSKAMQLEGVYFYARYVDDIS